MNGAGPSTRVQGGVSKPKQNTSQRKRASSSRTTQPLLKVPYKPVLNRREKSDLKKRQTAFLTAKTTLAPAIQRAFANLHPDDVDPFYEFATTSLRNEYLRQNKTESLWGYRLPDELLIRIFSFLEPEDILRAGCTCLRWFTLAGNEDLWQQIYHSTFLRTGDSEPKGGYRLACLSLLAQRYKWRHSDFVAHLCRGAHTRGHPPFHMYNQVVLIAGEQPRFFGEGNPALRKISFKRPALRANGAFDRPSANTRKYHGPTQVSTTVYLDHKYAACWSPDNFVRVWRARVTMEPLYIFQTPDRATNRFTAADLKISYHDGKERLIVAGRQTSILYYDLPPIPAENPSLPIRKDEPDREIKCDEDKYTKIAISSLGICVSFEKPGLSRWGFSNKGVRHWTHEQLDSGHQGVRMIASDLSFQTRSSPMPPFALSENRLAIWMQDRTLGVYDAEDVFASTSEQELKTLTMVKKLPDHIRDISIHGELAALLFRTGAARIANIQSGNVIVSLNFKYGDQMFRGILLRADSLFVVASGICIFGVYLNDGDKAILSRASKHKQRNVDEMSRMTRY